MKLFAAASILGSAAAFSIRPSFVPLARAVAPPTAYPRTPVARSAEATESVASPPAADGEEFEFEADVGRVMDLIVNSLYSDRDVFLRELVSNAADACDKKRFLALTDDGLSGGGASVKVRADPAADVLEIRDDGVGMSRSELVANLGKIANSGTRNFAKAVGDADAAANLIGQFGVGFYSAFLVADTVTVTTKSAVSSEDDKVYEWESSVDTMKGAGSSFVIREPTEDPFGEGESGTVLRLKLKKDAKEYAETSKLKELLQRYSEFIDVGISVWEEKTEYEQVPDVEANKDLKEGEEAKMKTVPKTTEGYEVLNTQKPIWLRPPKDVTEEEYKEFYKSAFKMQYDEPMKHTHFSLEGSVEFKALMYVPGMLPFELSRDMFDESAGNVRLYVRRVYINDQFDVLPRWLKFVKAVVDSNDLPLNVGREILQQSKMLNIVKKRMIKKSLDMINDIEKDEDGSKYVAFWNNFGKYLKVGVVEDDLHRLEIAPLLRFFSSASTEEYRSLQSYVDDMPEGQKDMYYITADSVKQASESPLLEKFKSKGYEVLFMTEPLDEITVQSLQEFRDVKLVDATKEDLAFDGPDEDEDEADKAEKEKLENDMKPVLEYLETLLAGKIQKAKVTTLLTDSPAALVQSAYGMSPTMQKYMKAQSVALGQNGDNFQMNNNQAVLEINPDHPVVRSLRRMVDDGGDETRRENFGMLIYDVAALAGGYDIEDAGDFAQRVLRLMDRDGGSDASAPEGPAASSASDDDDADEGEAVVPEVM